MAKKKNYLTCDGNYAAAHIAYMFSEVAAIITERYQFQAAALAVTDLDDVLTHDDFEVQLFLLIFSCLAGIARELGRRLQWDPVKEEFVGDDEANQYVDRPRRKPYVMPDPV